MKIKLTAQQRQDLLEALELAVDQLNDKLEEHDYNPNVYDEDDLARIAAQLERYNELAELFRRS